MGENINILVEFCKENNIECIHRHNHKQQEILMLVSKNNEKGAIRLPHRMLLNFKEFDTLNYFKYELQLINFIEECF